MEYRTLVRTLVDVLQEGRIPYMFVGGLAANYWGFPRATLDIDLVVALRRTAVGRLIRPLKRLGFDLEPEIVTQILAIGNRFMTRSPTIEYRVDFWIPKTIYEQAAFRRRRRGQVYGKPAWMIAPEDLILMKLLAGRGKDAEDARGVVDRQGGRLDWGYLETWAKRLERWQALKELR